MNGKLNHGIVQPDARWEHEDSGCMVQVRPCDRDGKVAYLPREQEPGHEAFGDVILVDISQYR